MTPTMHSGAPGDGRRSAQLTDRDPTPTGYERCGMRWSHESSATVRLSHGLWPVTAAAGTFTKIRCAIHMAVKQLIEKGDREK